MCLNLAARLTMDWFPSEERDLATTVATMANVLGQMVFSLLPPLLVHTPEQLGVILLVQWVPGFVVTALAWIYLRQRPPMPPSASAALQWREAEAKNHGAIGSSSLAAVQEMLHDAAALLRNPNFCLLASGFAVGTGTVWAVLILESQLITPCGYSDRIAGTAGAALLGTGVASGTSCCARDVSVLSPCRLTCCSSSQPFW
jgi:FLVCR family MFS transporter 7